MNSRWLEEDFSRSAPDHHDAVDGFPECLDVGAHLLSKIAFVLAFFDVSAVQALDVELIKDGRQWLDRLEKGLELLEQIFVENLGVGSAFVDVVFEDIPASEYDVVQIRERDKFLDQRRLVVSAFAKTYGAHLGKRANRLGES